MSRFGPARKEGLNLIGPADAHDLLTLGSLDRLGKVSSSLTFLPSPPKNLLPDGVLIDPFVCAAFALDVLLVRSEKGSKFKDKLVYPVDKGQGFFASFLKLFAKRSVLDSSKKSYSVDSPRNIVFNTSSHRGEEGTLALFGLSDTKFEFKNGDLVFEEINLEKIFHLPHFPYASGTYPLDLNYLPSEQNPDSVSACDRQNLVNFKSPNGPYIGIAVRGMGQHPTLGEINPRDFILPQIHRSVGILGTVPSLDVTRMFAIIKSKDFVPSSPPNPISTIKEPGVSPCTSLDLIAKLKNGAPKRPPADIDSSNPTASVGTVTIDISNLISSEPDIAPDLPVLGQATIAELTPPETLFEDAIVPVTIAMPVSKIRR